MANLGLIDLKLGLYIKVNVMLSKTNLKFISQKTWPKWPSIGTKYARFFKTNRMVIITKLHFL